ncbi:MAG: M42 family metallopeptidase [Cytophagales bacterium]|jgi:tetrahedral aminopeptidase|nr:M42 family metallopeptidase [Cytophagales bacterium]MCA6388280.1 M42 family metallopeptidase [Cytophagales bacterium]MCA6392377.1 M42 family metallopeptidase [Cytophagales bacterium]MCA6398524.1 M42 family metallopeptidase [Cytophagales bacterium]MCA6400803.1 M42 family metallopeptidase [Cytophagales bacterium]
MDKKSKQFLYEYLNNASPTGFESSGQQIWLNYIKPYTNDYMIDVYGTAVGIINPKASYKVVIEAHADEISWFVNYITDDGYIYVRRNGGSDHQIAPSMRVNIHTEKGIVKGVFGWPAIHVRDAGKEEAPSLKNIFIDCGAANKKEVESMGIHVGTVITFEADLMELNKNYLVGRALDNRMGGFMIAEVTRRLSENKKKLPFGLYVVNAVQEEIGLRGAEMISRKIKPDLAICTDVTHDTQSPMYNKKESGNLKCGLGPVVCIGPAVQNNVLKMITQTAEKKKIAFQRQAVSRSTGTDTDSFAYSAEGVASALISLPLKYMHTTVETVHKDDVENVINLIYEVLLQIKPNFDYRYIR